MKGVRTFAPVLFPPEYRYMNVKELANPIPNPEFILLASLYASCFGVVCPAVRKHLFRVTRYLCT